MAQVPPSPNAVAVRRQLVDLVRSNGPELLDDSRRVRAMLADAVAGATAEANLIALALASGVAARLRDSQHDPRAIPGVVDGLAQDLHRTSSVQPGDALWAVESVAAALGLVSGGPAPQAATGAPLVTPTGGAPGPHHLVVRVGSNRQVIAPDLPVTIGRDPSCTVTLDSPAVSRVHARVEHGPNGWEFRDAGSTQGSFVNGVAVTSTPVRDDTTVTLGQGDHAVEVHLGPFGEALTRAPQRPTPAQATVLPGQRPGGALGPGAPATELGGAASAGPPLTVTLAGTTRTIHPGTTLSIGREDDNDLVAAHTTVSRRHARIEHADGAWRLRDAGSTSGTWLDGRRLSAPATLAGRQEFVLGDATSGDRLRTETAGSPPPSGGPRPPHAAGRGSGPSRSRLVAAGVAGLALVLVAGGLGTWLLLDDDEPKEPVSKKPDTVEISRDDIARATVHLSTPDGAGSGVVIDREKGLILTNAHVAASSAPGLGIYLRQFADEQDPNPERVRVDVSDGLDESAEPRFYAELVAADGYLDVAVLRITTKLSGAPADADDLADLVEVPLGDSDDLDTADDVAFYGYPAAAGSTAPTYTTGVVSGPVQDRRLDEFRAVINTTADISPGNSGGPAVDDSGQVVGVATWRTFNDLGETAFSRIRPINLAKPVIEAAVGGTSYRSPWAERAPRTADVTFWDYGAPGGTAGRVSADCARTGPGASPTTLLLDYKGFPGGRHTDVYAALRVQVAGEWKAVATSVTTFATKLPTKGCMTLTFDEDLPPGTYWLKVGVGGDLRIVVDDPDFTIE